MKRVLKGITVTLATLSSSLAFAQDVEIEDGTHVGFGGGDSSGTCNIVDYGPNSGGRILPGDQGWRVTIDAVDTGGGYDFGISKIQIPETVPIENNDVPPDEYFAVAVLRCPTESDGPTSETPRTFSMVLGGLSDEGLEPCTAVAIVGTTTYRLVKARPSRCP